MDTEEQKRSVSIVNIGMAQARAEYDPVRQTVTATLSLKGLGPVRNVVSVEREGVLED